MSIRSIYTGVPAFKLISSTGTNGQVLTSDGAGSTTWETTSSPALSDTSVTQTTSPTTAVELNETSGIIVCTNNIRSPSDRSAFALQNSTITAKSLVNVSIMGQPDIAGGGAGYNGINGYLIASVIKVEAGYAYILISNLDTTGSSSGVAFSVRFQVVN